MKLNDEQREDDVVSNTVLGNVVFDKIAPSPVAMAEEQKKKRQKRKPTTIPLLNNNGNNNILAEPVMVVNQSNSGDASPLPSSSPRAPPNRIDVISSSSASENDDLLDSQPVIKLTPYYVPLGPEDSTLVFESRFEEGNLRKAIQV